MQPEPNSKISLQIAISNMVDNTSIYTDLFELFGILGQFDWVTKPANNFLCIPIMVVFLSGQLVWVLLEIVEVASHTINLLLLAIIIAIFLHLVVHFSI